MNIEEIREYYKDLPDGKLQEIAKNEIQDLSEDARIVLKEEVERRKILENAFMAVAKKLEEGVRKEDIVNTMILEGCIIWGHIRILY